MRRATRLRCLRRKFRSTYSLAACTFGKYAFIPLTSMERSARFFNHLPSAHNCSKSCLRVILRSAVVIFGDVCSVSGTACSISADSCFSCICSSVSMSACGVTFSCSPWSCRSSTTISSSCTLRRGLYGRSVCGIAIKPLPSREKMIA